ncbi:uncharacterized protein V6R79_026272 [Siganus canaliculatus]
MTSRQCTIELKNGSTYTLTGMTIFMESGTCERSPPPSLSHSETGTARISAPDAAAGVLTYNLKDPSGQMMDEKVALMFHNRADVRKSENIFAVGFFNKTRATDYSLYEEMHSGQQMSFIRRKAGQPLSYAGEHVTINGTMSDTFNAVIKQNSCFAVGLVAKSRACDETLYKHMRSDDPGTFLRGKAGQPVSYDGKDVTINVSMSEGNICVIKVELHCIKGKVTLTGSTALLFVGLNKFLDSILSSSRLKLLVIMTSRQCIIRLKNGSTHTLSGMTIFMESGTCEQNASPLLSHSETGTARITALDTAAGVLTYNLKDPSGQMMDEKVALMFYNRADVGQSENIFAVGFVNKAREVCYNLYEEMRSGNQTHFIRRKAGQPMCYAGQHVTINATMSDTFNAVVTVETRFKGPDVAQVSSEPNEKPDLWVVTVSQEIYQDTPPHLHPGAPLYKSSSDSDREHSSSLPCLNRFLDSIPSSSRLKLLGTMSSHRQCTIKFKNESTFTLRSPSVFEKSGICEDPLPPSLRPSESDSALFRNTPETAAGVIGVLTYDLHKASGELMQEKMTVMFSNLYDFNLYSNWFAVGFFDRSRACDDSLCDEMYKGPETTFVRGKAGKSLTYEGLHVTINATMSDSYTAVIKLEAEDSLSTHRQCTLDFKNESTSTLLNPSVFIESGICEDPLPPSLGPSESGSALFKKTPYAATGDVGVLTYDLKNASGELMQEKMAVMFSNPYDFNLYSNWFAVGFFDRSRVCDYSLYDEMYNGSETTFVRGKAGRSLIYKGQHVTINASMSDTYTPVIKLEVEDKPDPSHRQCTFHFKNQSKSTLLSPSEFMQRGNVVKTPPKTLSPAASGSALFQNNSGDVWGAAGVMTYNVRDSSGKVMDRKVAIMFHNSSQHGNIFTVGLFIRSRPCDESLYNEMLNEEPTTFVRGEAGQPLSYDGQGVTIKADMSAAHNSVIQVEFSDD